MAHVRRSSDILRQRLRAQRLVGRPFARPEEAVAWLGAVQSQDYAGAKWGLAQRTAGATDASLDACFDRGTLVRTHLLRPTWHFVCPADIRWMLALTAPRVRPKLATYDRKLGLDGRVRARSQALLARALRDGKHLTRTELGAALKAGGIPCRGQRLAHVVAHAELDAVICSGARRGKQFTYAVLDERVAPVKPLDREEALAELVRRYFTGHGPATVRDCAWWSGLRVADIEAAIAAADPPFEQTTRDGRTYWFTTWFSRPSSGTPPLHLLPNYDELLIAYRDRDVFFDPTMLPRPDPMMIFAHVLTIDGQVAGMWRRRLGKGEVVIETKLARLLGSSDGAALRAAVRRFERFLGVPARLA